MDELHLQFKVSHAAKPKVLFSRNVITFKDLMSEQHRDVCFGKPVCLSVMTPSGFYHVVIIVRVSRYRK